MQIETIRLRDFRNYHSLILTPHPGVNILLGQNGSGKTNLLEAVHYCALGRSHRTGLDREVVRKGAMMAASGVTLRKKSGKTEIAVKLTPSEARKKTVFIDCKRAERISALMGHVQCVIFSPEDLMLVKEGPAIRRRMLDMMLSQLSTAYFSALQQYQKALEQRVRDEAKLVRQYISAPETTPFAVLYLATEGLYAQILGSRSGLAEKLQQQGILLAGPTTVTALLNALAMGFRTLAINRKATEVWQVLGAAKMQYDKFGDLLQKARKKVDEAGKVLDEADHRNHIIQKHLRRVETLDDPTAAEAVPELFD